MSAVTWITTACLLITAAQSYILLTADLDDVHDMARQLAASPVADQVKNIWRRASSLFNQQLAKSSIHKRGEDENESRSIENPSRIEQWDQSDQEWNGQQKEEKSRAERRQHGDLVNLGKNASFYLSSIQQIMENV